MKLHFLRLNVAPSTLFVSLLFATFGTCLAQDTIDTDEDGMSDVWENANFGNLDQGPYSDPDGDRLVNLLEYRAELDPNIADFEGRAGELYAEKWNGIAGSGLEDLTGSAAFKDLAHEATFLTSAETAVDVDENYGRRLRGSLIAPVTGSYTFYIASDDSSELWLGKSESKFTRYRVASVSGVTAYQEWTKYSSQKSSLIQLVAGQKYYFEALMKEGSINDNLSIAWTYTDDSGLTAGQPTITVIPGRLPDANSTVVLESYTPDPDDMDDDGLPDAWELTVGLNSGDNGRIHSYDGSYADPDNDGFNNYEEYLTGNDPFVAGGNFGYVRRDIWTGINGTDLSSLTSSAAFTQAADSSEYISSALDFASEGNKYGQRVSGSIVPTHSGNWRFWISGDDSAELWLSDTWKASGKRRAAYLTSKVSQNTYDTTPSQESALIPMQAGQPYYFEILHKEFKYADHLSLAWAYDSPNWALATLGSTASQSSTASGGEASRAIDGNTNGSYSNGSVTFTGNAQNSWLQVDFGQIRPVNRVVLWNRTNGTTGERLSNFRISILDVSGTVLVSEDFFPPGTGSADSSFTWDLDSPVNGSSIKISLLGLNNTGNGILSLAEVQAFEWFAESIRQIVPASVLRTQTPDSDDADGDSLPDAWELQYALSPSDNGSSDINDGEYGDPDGDGVPNLLEYINGSSPVSANGVIGELTRETWKNLSGGTIYEFEREPTYLYPADVKDTATRWTFANRGDYYGERLRGLLTATETGWHTFWIAGDDEARLSISTDSRKFQKRAIASVGDGSFIFNTRNTTAREYDKYPSQQSAPVYLTAGNQYFIEILHSELSGGDHISVAWKTPAGSQESLPFSVLSSFLYDVDDADDDDLPDSWESQYALDPYDNGSIDRGREGALGDKDGDGLNNREEYLLGTNPHDTDSDQDGLDDFSEARNLGSDPNTADSGLGTILSDFAGSSGNVVSGDWLTGPNETLLSLDRRGTVTWPFTLGQTGINILEVLATAQGNTWAGTPLTIDVTIVRSSDSKRWFVGTFPVYDNYGEPAQVLAILPHLAADSYEAEISVNNVSESRNIRIDRVRILDAAGTDANNNGIADWLENRVAESNGVLSGNSSAVSPACVEGIARDVSLSWLQAGSTNIALTPGIDDRWFANVDLPSDGSSLTTTAWFEDGTFSMNAPVSWSPTNVLSGGSITVRAGDSLRLTAHPGTSPDTGTVAISGLAIPIDTTADTPVVQAFESSNWALASKGSTAGQSGTVASGVASRAIDGNTDGTYLNNSVTATSNAENSWWEVDFGQNRAIDRVVLWNRADGKRKRLSNFRISVLDEYGMEIDSEDFYPPGTVDIIETSLTWELDSPLNGRFVRVSILGLNNLGDGVLSLAEVQVFPPDSYTLDATHTAVGGQVTTGTMTVNVVEPDFGPALGIRTDRWRDWLLPDVKYELPLEFDASMKAFETGPYEGGHRLNISTSSDKEVNVVARTEAGSTVAAVGTVDPYLIGETYDTGYVEILDTLADGSTHGRISVVADRLPPGGYIEIQIWAGGAQFLDGTSLTTLSATDFDANGVAYLDIYYPSQTATSSFCQYTRLYDADGTLLTSY
ncbi:MAG: discoidin domain-containing protein [Luteolibacter sp.]